MDALLTIVSTIACTVIGFFIGFTIMNLAMAAYRRRRSRKFHSWYNSMGPEERLEFDQTLSDRLEDK